MNEHVLDYYLYLIEQSTASEKAKIYLARVWDERHYSVQTQ